MNESKRGVLPKKLIQSGTCRLVLGTRAPSPAMSAQRETPTAARRLRLSVLRTLCGRGRPRSQYLFALIAALVLSTTNTNAQPKVNRPQLARQVRAEFLHAW